MVHRAARRLKTLDSFRCKSWRLSVYYTLTLHAFNRLTARRRSDAFATRRSSSARAHVCISNRFRKAKHADVISARRRWNL